MCPLRAIDLTTATRELLAPVCRDCVWWQSRNDTPGGTDLRRAWEREAEAEAGFFGRALVEGDAVIGYLHAAAARLVPRAQCLPAGPPSSDAYVLTCSYFHDEEYLHGFQLLLIELEAALKLRRVTALEAFGLRRSRPDDRFRGYLREQNLFHPEILEGGGFRAVQVRGEVARFRLELATIVAAPRHSMVWQGQAEGAVSAQPV